MEVEVLIVVVEVVERVEVVGGAGKKEHNPKFDMPSVENALQVAGNNTPKKTYKIISNAMILKIVSIPFSICAHCAFI